MKTILKLYLMVLTVLTPTALLIGAAVALSFWGCSTTLKALPKL